MPATSLDLMIEQGTTWRHGFIPKINDTPIADADSTARAQVRSKVNDPTVLYEWSTVRGNIVIDPDTGAVTLMVDPSDSSTWTWRNAVYDLEVTTVDGSTYRVVQGKITVSPEVTRG